MYLKEWFVNQVCTNMYKYYIIIYQVVILYNNINNNICQQYQKYYYTIKYDINSKKNR